ncbi:MAG TPA: PAS domain-containing protein [Stellaceae bacterium]|nr:PAS domain-containing protein [Stellaceae bacterium]
MTARPKRDRGVAGFLADGGEMGALMRAFDWSKTPLGVPEQWPQSLQTAVGIMLSSRYAMFVWWGQQLVNLYNDAYRPFLGKKHPGSLGQSARAVWAEIWDLIGPRTEAVLERGEATFDEALLLVMERYGYPEETYFTFSYSPIRNDRGEIGGLFCAVTDETSRVIGERRLKLLREVAATASETHTPEQVCAAAATCISRNAHDLPFAILYLGEGGGRSARLVARVGVEPGDSAAPPAVDLEDANTIWPLAEAKARGEPLLVEDLQSRLAHLPTGVWDRPPARAVVMPLSEQGQTGIAGFLVAGLNPYLLFEGEYSGFVGLLAGQIAAGIANARAYEEERRRAEALAEIDRAKTAFFSNVSHEFRTPLTLMLGPLEDMLAAPAQEMPGRRDDLALVHRNGLRLLRLVNTLLDFSRIEAGRVEASYEPADLSTATADLASVFRAATDKAGLSLAVDCPPLGEPVWVDRDMWEKIVLNLLSNAFKFTLKGGIAVRLRRESGSAALSVEDTGIGIPAREIPRLFDRFHRVAGVQGRTHEGTGIGLALVQELVRLHSGAVRVASIPGAGSTFTVTIPLGTAHLPPDRLRAERTPAATGLGAEPFVEEALRWLPEADGSAAPEIEPALLSERQIPASAAAEGERATVLIADDNADMRDYLRRLLGVRYRVRAAANGAEALAALRAELPDLLLSDVMMPRMDGYALLRAVRADPDLAGLPVILLSARAGEEASRDGLEAGADDYLVKPFSARELIARVAANIETARIRRTAERSLRQAYERLRQDEERWRDALTAAAMGSWRADLATGLGTRDADLNRILGTAEAETTQAVEDRLRLIHPDDKARAIAAWKEAVEKRGTYETEFRILRDDGAVRWLSERGRFVGGEEGGPGFMTGLTIDITERKRAEESVLGQKRVLEMVATGAPLADTLDALTLFLEGQEPGMICDILLTDDGVHFRPGSSPGIPSAYKLALHEAIKTIPITPPYFVTCAETAHCSRIARVSDVAKDQRYAGAWRELMLASGLQAVRLTPIHASDGRMIGCLALYFREPRDPNPARPQLIEIGTHLAAIALERHRAEEILRNNETRLRLATEAAEVGFWDVDPVNDVLVWPPVVKAMFGIPPEAPVSMAEDFHARLHPDDREWVSAAYAAACDPEQRALYDVEYRTIGKEDGVVRWVAAKGRGLFDGEGRCIRVLGTAIDITPRKQIETALRESEARLRVALGAAGLGTWETDLANGRNLWDGPLAALLGFSPEQAAKASDRWLEVVHPEDRDRVSRAFRAAAEGGLPYREEFRVRRADGAERVFATSGVLVAPGRMIGAVQDVTEARTAEAVLARDKAELERLVAERSRALEAEVAERQKIEAALHQSQRLEAIGQLTGGIAHDFNNLLAVVMGQAEAIAVAADGNPRIARMATATQRAAERGAQLTGQLLAFARRQQLQPVTTAVHLLVSNIGDLVRQAVGEAVTVELRVEPGLWPSHLDPAQFESAILNLAINARDAMPQGGRLVIEARNVSAADVKARHLDLAPGEYVMVSVTDTGAGMTPGVLRRAFEPFFTTKDVGKGTGLGLAQIYGFAKQSGGTATIDSTLEAGTTVAMYFPRADTESIEAASSTEARAVVRGQGKTVLLVEDQSEVREVIEMSLDGLGFRVVTAEDGIAARKVLETHETIDLLLTDVVMPNGVSGLDLAREARRLRQDIKIVLVSGYLRDSDTLMSAASDLLFLVKPFSQAQLAEAIAAALNGGSRGGAAIQ